MTHDRRSAAEAGAESTGHANDAAFSFGPTASHLALLPSGATRPPAAPASAAEVDGPFADASVAELVAGVGRGVLVSDFWYTRLLDPRTLALTGLTRNGIWLIEDGELARTGPQLPLHPVVRPGADARQRQGRRADRDADPRRHLLGDVTPLDLPGAAPRLLELHRRRLRLKLGVPRRR